MSEKPAAPHIPLQLSMDDPEPLYAQIESQLRDFILGGALPPGTRLPSIRALASYLACSVITTRRAYDDLESEGFIRTRPGMGSVVADIPQEIMSARRLEPVYGAFKEAVRAGRRAGLTEEDLHKILDDTLQEKDTNVHQGGTS